MSENEKTAKKKKKGLVWIIIGVLLTGSIIWAVIYFKAEEVPEHIEEQFNTDSSQDSTEIELVDSLFNDLDKDFEDDSEEADTTKILV